ncbi:MAG TPA: serine/threonine-protein phosphatase [Leptolyngbyaceae cyanobacterium M33_DOE_097]|uniref:Serine/threonine-protein phosphatase n=1 Tax=Oscillatoriales cyanobacterium SpSt-418 TaxID=2282169 RepID=A0A7C3KHQ6_9CYAN|nr:serine/threonine-protein phosphatase [Leptolyngbyaceae cyanobacterium M33_DOE_097]
MKLIFSGMTDTGVLRSVNQDAYYVDESQGRFFIVADGMGGHAGGQEASQIATEVIRQYLEEHWLSSEASPTLLRNALIQANQAILADQRLHFERSEMGTTVVVLIFREKPWCAHIGDSRLYRLRGPNLEQLTEDHTWVARAVRSGDISIDQARIHPWRHMLAQCLGRKDLRVSDIEPIMLDVQQSDRLLLCSDGLTEELSDQIIAQRLKNIRACDKAVASLIKEAKDHGGRDNITVVIVAVDESTRQSA